MTSASSCFLPPLNLPESTSLGLYLPDYALLEEVLFPVLLVDVVLALLLEDPLALNV